MSTSTRDEQVHRAKEAFKVWQQKHGQEMVKRTGQTHWGETWDMMPKEFQEAWIVMVDSIYQQGRVDEQFNMG